jgi:hypothetical protein
MVCQASGLLAVGLSEEDFRSGLQPSEISMS